MQIIALGLWQAVCLAIIIAGCVAVYFYLASRNGDDEVGPEESDEAEVFQHSPLGFHIPSETKA